VQLGLNAVDVLVTEGTVAVDQPRVETASTPERSSPEPQTLAVLEAGNRIIVEIADDTRTPAVVTPVSEAELTERLAWRVPKLEFSATPLAEAVPLINQYSRVRIEIGDASLGRVELSGVLRADNLYTLLRLLTHDYGIEVERRGSDRIVLQRGAAASRRESSEAR
jgi:transmembrane sensor